MATSDNFFLGADPHNPQLQFPVTQAARAVHSTVIGASRAGKSKLLQDWILQDIMAGRGCALIDPKGDLYWDVLASLASLDEAYWPGLAARVTLVDPSDTAARVVINPLEVRDGATPARVRQEVFSILRKVWALDDTRMPRMDLVLKRALHLLVDTKGTLADLPRLLTDHAYRERLLATVQDASLRSFWTNEFPSSDAARFQWTASILTRIEGLLDDPVVRSMFGSAHSSVDFRRAMARGDVVLTTLSRGRLGEETAQLLGGVVTAMIQLAAESRQNIWPAERRRRFYLYCDEFHGYMVSSSLRELLAEGRGYGLSLIVAHQNLSQLDSALRDSIYANCNIRICLRTNAADSDWLSREVFHVRGDRLKSRSLRFLTFGRMPIPIGFDNAYYSHAEESRQNRDALHHLPDRGFWAHIADRDETVRLRTVEIPPFDRRVAEERVARFKALLRDTQSQPAVSPGLPTLISPAANAIRHYDWTPPVSRPAPPHLN